MQNNEALTLRRLGQIAIRRGDTGRARALLRESLKLNMDVGEWRGAVTSLAAYAAALAADGRAVEAARLCGAVDAFIEPRHLRLTLMLDQVFYEATRAGLRATLGASAYAAAWEEGSAMSPEQAAEGLGEQPAPA